MTQYSYLNIIRYEMVGKMKGSMRHKLITPQPLLTRRVFILLSLMLLAMFSGCVVKEELDDTYNQAHLGLNQWSLLEQDNGSYVLDFDVGYLIGLIDEEGIQEIKWRFELITKDREFISFSEEQMRESSPEKNAIFVEGRRVRRLELATILSDGETYILWFTLQYRDGILHEQLFPLVAGEEGGNPSWIEELLDESIDDTSQLGNSGIGETTEDAEVMEIE
jgi:hypothetical protein